MDNVAINKMDEIVMKLLHYFITEQGYNPIVLHGAQNEIWLENMEGPYQIVRIVTNYIHNDEQFEFDLYRTNQIVRRIKRKTFSFRVQTLSLFINLGENVHQLEEQNQFGHITAAKLEEMDDISRYRFIVEEYPTITAETNFQEEGSKLFLKITEDINRKNQEEAARAEDVFKTKKPIVTYALILVNVLAFLFLFMQDRSLNPNTLYRFGAVTNDCLKNGEFYRLFTAIFLHAGFIHLICNMYSLYIIGPQLESFFGKTRYLIIYLVSGLFGTLMSTLFLGDFVVSVGASGAIFGLLGALVYFGYHYRVYLGGVIKSQIIPLILLNLAIGFVVSGIDMAAHIGGLIGGMLITMAVGVKYKSTSGERINGLVMTAIFAIFLIFMAFRGM